jgi:membrane associated rhomboid family serine protease
VARVDGSQLARNVGRMNGMSRAVLALLIVNVAAFAAEMLLPNGRAHLIAAAALWFPGNEHFGVWQLVTYMFLHADISHIFFNMFALVSFGTILEREWGAARFLVFYFLCGIGAGLVQLGVVWHDFAGQHARLVAAGMTPGAIAAMLATGEAQLPVGMAIKSAAIDLYRSYHAPTLGASGAIYGLLVAFGFLHPNAKLALMFVPVPIAAKYFIPILLGLDLLSGITGFSLFGAGVAHFAHVGGALIGFLLMLLWRRRGRIPAGPGAIRPHPTG